VRGRKKKEKNTRFLTLLVGEFPRPGERGGEKKNATIILVERENST